jgi:NADH-quinone oxidoreductase subunit L
MLEYAWLIPVFPFIAFILIGLLPKRTLGWENGGGYAIGGAVGALVLSMLVIWEVLNSSDLPYQSSKSTWLVIGDSVSLEFGIWIDQLTAIMLLVISVVGTLVVIYSGGYMHEEGVGRRRYYAEIMLFISVMYGLVLSDNYFEMFIFWELVGLCSYLLIGFWYEKPSAASAAKRAFIVTRVGDIMFMAGLIILFWYTDALDFGTLFANGGADTEAHFASDPNMLTLATALIFGGAIGKSAQFPLHEWLPDAMEGPTTVSALIHAATMVKAGVYLTARTYPLLVLTPDSLLFVAIIGGVTALLAATVALAANDIKRVLAYSTISQLGYMILGLGAGGYLFLHAHEPAAAANGYAAATFHLMNHGFFKALLFLCAGSVIHAVGTNDMRLMGGLRKKMPITSITMLIGALAIAGMPPLSGFWSKDEVLAAVYSAGEFDWIFFILWFLGVATAFMTAFYMFRMWFMTFSGEPRSEVHAHESPKIMTAPLMILAGLACISGFALFIGSGFKAFLGSAIGVHEAEPLADVAIEIFTDPLTYVSLVLAIVGVTIAWRIYYRPGFDRTVFARGVPGTFQRALENRWYISKFYDDFAYKIWYGFSLLADRFDRHVIDGIVNGFAFLGARSGNVVRKGQSGDVRRYTSLVVVGIVLLILFMVYIIPWASGQSQWFWGWP